MKENTTSVLHKSLLWWCLNKTGSVLVNVSLRCILATIVALEKSVCITYSEYVCICSPRYPAYNAHVPFCHLWPARLYNIFPHSVINSKFSKKKLLKMKCVYNFRLETFPVRRTIERDVIKDVYWSSCTWLFLANFNVTWIASTDLRKILKQFHENSPSRSRVVPCGQTDWHHNEANSSFSQFCECT